MKVSSRNSRAGTALILGAIALAHFLLHVLTNGNYGLFRDEFYYIACSDRLAWGYVDQTPLALVLLSGARAVLGDSVHAIRLLPALAGALLILLAGLLAAELGGGRFARVLAGLCTAIVPSYLVQTGYYSMNAFDLLFWAASFYLLIRILKTGNGRLWLLVGLVVGLGLLNKLSMFIFGIGLAAGLILTSGRRHLLTWSLWAGGGIALALFLPHILWQIENGWPTLEFIANAKAHKIAESSPLSFLLGQIVEIHPLNFPIWLAGLGFLLSSREKRPFRLLGLIYIVIFIFLLVQNSKGYYLAPAYTVLLAAGACSIEAFLERRRWSRAGPALIALLVAGGALTAPLAVPVLPVKAFISDQELSGIRPSEAEKHEPGALPQHFADRFGWENMARIVASVYESLPPEKRVGCAVVTANYGEAGAIDYYRPLFGLPPAVSGHNNYYLWGPGHISGKTIISVGIAPEELSEVFEVVEPAATIASAYAMPYEADLTVYVCSGLKLPLEDAWSRIKHYI